MRWLAGTLAGVGAASAVVFFGLRRTERKLAERGATLATTLERRGDAIDTLLAAEGDQIEAEIRRIAATQGARIAQLVAEQYIRESYGLTPERIARLQYAARSLSA